MIFKKDDFSRKYTPLSEPGQGTIKARLFKIRKCTKVKLLDQNLRGIAKYRPKIQITTKNCSQNLSPQFTELPEILKCFKKWSFQYSLQRC